MLLPIIMAGVQGGYGLYRTIKAQRAIDALNKKGMPSLMESQGPLQENRRLYLQQFRQGLTPATKAMAQQQFATSQLAQQRAATDTSGGQLSSALSRMNAADTSRFALGLGAQNEAAQRQGMAGLVGANQAIYGLQREDAAQRLAQFQNLQAQYGKARQDALSDIIGAGTGLATGLMAQAEAEEMRKLYKKYLDMQGATGAPPGTMTTDNSSLNLNTPSGFYQGLQYLNKFKTPSSSFSFPKQ